MEQKEFDRVVEETVESIKKLLVSKGAEYAGSADRLANFKRGASLTGCTPLQVLFIYMSKHYDAISSFIKKDANDEDMSLTEPIEGRIDDLINYGILLKALIREMNQPMQHGASLRGLGNYEHLPKSYS